MQHIVKLSDKELELISLICHEFKDTYRGCADAVKPVMFLELNLVVQTNGAYDPDPTYDIKD